jgi:predicted aconitase with swiveling domain
VIHPRTILASALLLTAAAAAVGGLLGGTSCCAGILASGALAAANFWALGRRVEGEVRLVRTGRGSTLRAGLLSGLRLAGSLLATWLLLCRFPPGAVLVGLCTVVAAIVLQAAGAAIRRTPLPE